MTPKELAQQIHGREYGRRAQLTPEEAKAAKDSGIVVVYGASDDLVELEGAVQDERGTHALYFTKAGLLENACGDEDCPYFIQIQAKAAPLEPKWNRGGHDGPAWTFKTAIPHETFDILEDGEVFCRGIVFALADVPGEVQHLRDQLHEAMQREYTPEQWERIQSAKAGIRGVVELFGDEGGVALALCASDHAAS